MTIVRDIAIVIILNVLVWGSASWWFFSSTAWIGERNRAAYDHCYAREATQRGWSRCVQDYLYRYEKDSNK